MSQLNRLVTLSLLSACFWLQGCTSVKKTLGIERDPPDEFAVMPCTQPLDMPPDFFVLPKPQPGTPRPQDVKAMESKRKELFGSTKMESTKTGGTSPGQTVLLEMAGTPQADIREKIDKEYHQEASKKNIVLETLGIKQSKSDIIDPHAEAKRLTKEGVPQTNTPQDNKSAIPAGESSNTAEELGSNRKTVRKLPEGNGLKPPSPSSAGTADNK